MQVLKQQQQQRDARAANLRRVCRRVPLGRLAARPARCPPLTWRCLAVAWLHFGCLWLFVCDILVIVFVAVVVVTLVLVLWLSLL